MQFLYLLCFAFILILGGCEPTLGNTQVQDVYESEQADFRVVRVTDGLSHPWSLAFLPNGEFLVTQRSGELFRISSDGAQKTQIQGVPKVYHEGQGGLLDIITEPEFKDGGWVYFSYAAAYDYGLANTEVARARLDLRQNRLKDVEVIFQAMPKVEGYNHWGSRLLFAPDGSLYVTLGERFDYKEEAQNPQNHLGTIVRILPDGRVPDDNPFVGDAALGLPTVYSYGHRNVQGIALNPLSGAVWAHEHGPKGGDEINILKAGANYGWPKVTYGINYWGSKITDLKSAPWAEDPILQWTPSIAPSGMAFYTGNRFDAWRGDLFVGALAGQHLRRIELDGDVVVGQEELLGDLGMRIRDVRDGPDGFLYVLSDEDNGALLRLEPAGD